MKRFFVCFAVITAIVFMVGCGGSGSSEKNYEKDNGGTCIQEEEFKYRCIDGASYKCLCADWDYETYDCKKYLWQNPITCSTGCNEWSGVCECSEEEADAENHECMGDYQLECSSDEYYTVADYFWHIDLFCINGCDKSTGKCNLCRYDTFTCYKANGYDYSFKCEDGHFEEDELCLKGCNKSTGKCNPCETGSFTCHENDSYKCEKDDCYADDYTTDSYECNRFNVYEWCDENGCDTSTGKCRNSTKEDIEECSSQGAFRCNGNMVQKCDQEEWKNFEDCADAGCNSETGRCI